MKIILSVITLVLLLASTVQASNPPPQSQAGSYNAQICCLPVLNPSSTTSLNLGTFFANSIINFDKKNVPPPTVSWSLTGANQALYNINVTCSPYGSDITGVWTVRGQTQTNATSVDYRFQASQISCDNSIPVPIVFTVSTIDTQHGNPKWTLTVTVNATI